MPTMKHIYIILSITTLLVASSNALGDGSFFNWKFHHPPGSSMGLFLALAIPLDIPNKSVYVAYNFEANYRLPGNETYVEYPPLIDRSASRSDIGKPEEPKEPEETEKSQSEMRKTNTKMFTGIDRRLVYDAMETKFTSHGYPGQPCLLRIICETAMHSVTETNGVFGNIFHVIFTPSTSINDGLDDAYEEAEITGETTHNCEEYHKKCSVSFLDLISWMEGSKY